jgi:hypothetical protein
MENHGWWFELKAELAIQINQLNKLLAQAKI